MVIFFFQDVRPYSGSGGETGLGEVFNIDRSDTFARRRMDIEGEK